MKFVIFLCCAVAVVLADPIQDKWNKVHKGCQSDPDLFVDEEIFEKLKKGESPALPNNFGDHAYCMLNELGYLDDKGDVIKSNIKDAVARSSPSDAVQAEKECSSIDKFPSEAALALFGCFGKYKINIGQF